MALNIRDVGSIDGESENYRFLKIVFLKSQEGFKLLKWVNNDKLMLYKDKNC